MNLTPEIEMEIGQIDRFNIIESQKPPVLIVDDAAFYSTSGESGGWGEAQQEGDEYAPDARRERIGNNKKKLSPALKKKRAKIAKASRRRNRKP